MEIQKNEFRIWALGEQKLQIEFSGVFEYKNAHGPTANTGEGSGIAKIEGNTAIFKPDGAEDECKISLKFSRGKVVVTQTGICGFGFNVIADGTYKRVSSAKPKFDSGKLILGFPKTESPASLGRFAGSSRPPAVKFAPCEPLTLNSTLRFATSDL